MRGLPVEAVERDDNAALFAGRQWMSATLTTASCRCAETTSRSSLSSAMQLETVHDTAFGFDH